MTEGGAAVDMKALERALPRILDRPSRERLQHAAGGAAKGVAFEEAERDLGRDRTFSGFNRRSARLNAGYDLEGDGVVLKLRSRGLWTLANTGRRKAPKRGDVRPRRKQALLTPWGPKHSAQPSFWGGFGTLERVEDRLDDEVVDAVDAEIGRVIEGVF